MHPATRKLFPNYPDEARIEAFYAALGKAISWWNLVETHLYLIAEASTRPQIPGAFAAGFHAVQTFQMKLVITDMAVRFRLLDHNRPELLKSWEQLFEKARDKAIRRNHFAHFSMEVRLLEKTESKRIKLVPLFYDARYTDGIKNNVEYGVSEILEIAKSFSKLSNELSEFVPHLGRLPLLPPTSS